MTALKEQIGTADLVSCRYLVEHCHDPVGALRALGQILAAEGRLLIEVPDSSSFLATGDYCFLWEEHTSYLLEPTLRGLAEAAGFEVEALYRYHGQLEDALCAVLRPTDRAPGISLATAISGQKSAAVFEAYRGRFEDTRTKARDCIEKLAGSGGDGVALFGVGHQAIMFVNGLGLADHIGMVVDDDANKRGRLPPGLTVPIVSSADLLANERVRACLLAVSPRVDTIVRQKLGRLTQRGVTFHSIYAGHPDFLIAEPRP